MPIFIGVGAMYRHIPHDTKMGVRRRPTEMQLAMTMLMRKMPFAMHVMVRNGLMIAMPVVMGLVMMMTVNMVSMRLMRETHRWQGYATY